MTLKEIDEGKLLNKITWRLIPLLLLLFIIAYIDRFNIGYAALQMNEDLGFSAQIYGFGSGIFFLGYCLFEIPSNLILARMGARASISRIVITWGIIATGMVFVQGAESFYILRFLLGVAEAGFFPGIVLYITYWFPAVQHARILALFISATAISGVLGGPISGLLLTLDGIAGLEGWQWLFLLEGVPAIAMGFVALRYLIDAPEQAEWLTPEERFWLQEKLRLKSEHKQQLKDYTLVQTLVNPTVWLVGLILLTRTISLYGISFWLPQIIQGFSGVSDLWVGFLSAIPYVVSAIGMIVIGNYSDRTGEHRTYVAISAFVGAVGLLLSAYSHEPVTALAALSLAGLGIWGGSGPLWALNTAFFGGTTAAAGSFALINTVGSVGGLVAPYIIGLFKDMTHSFTAGLFFMATALLVSGTMTLLLRPETSPEQLEPLSH